MSIWHLVILLVVVVVIFGTGKLRNVGSDLGAAIRDFKKGLNDHDKGDARSEEVRRETAEHLRADPPPVQTETRSAEGAQSRSETREPK
jgi:sec-independent protein translocase protein TatA